MSTLSGACVLCVLVRHLMGSAGCGVARLKSPSAQKGRGYTIGAICRSLPLEWHKRFNQRARS